MQVDWVNAVLIPIVITIAGGIFFTLFGPPLFASWERRRGARAFRSLARELRIYERAVYLNLLPSAAAAEVGHAIMSALLVLVFTFLAGIIVLAGITGLSVNEHPVAPRGDIYSGLMICMAVIATISINILAYLSVLPRAVARLGEHRQRLLKRWGSNILPELNSAEKRAISKARLAYINVGREAEEITSPHK